MSFDFSTFATVSTKADVADPLLWSRTDTSLWRFRTRVAKADEAEQAARRHAEFYRDLVAHSGLGHDCNLPARKSQSMAAKLDNVRSELDWSFSPRAANRGAQDSDFRNENQRFVDRDQRIGAE